MAKGCDDSLKLVEYIESRTFESHVEMEASEIHPVYTSANFICRWCGDRFGFTLRVYFAILLFERCGPEELEDDFD
jgi:hypothetical protein